VKTLFSEEEKTESPKKVLHKKIVLHKREKLPFEEEINVLLASTSNRAFISSALHLEVELLSGILIKLSEEYPEKRFREILNYAKSILENMPNYYVSQALQDSEEGATWLHFENPYKKKMLLKKK
jgi:hypothetical protein